METNIPLGAEHDPKAPYNQDDFDEEEMGMSEEEWKEHQESMYDDYMDWKFEQAREERYDRT